MTLQEAIKTGLPFKRPSFASYVSPGYKVLRYRGTQGGSLYVTQKDALADDWEVELPNTIGPWKVGQPIYAVSTGTVLDVAKLRRELDTALEDIGRLNRNDDILTTRQRELSDKIAELAANQAASLPGWLLARVEALEVELRRLQDQRKAHPGPRCPCPCPSCSV